MNPLACFAVIFLVTVPVFALAEDFNIEDEKLTVLPKTVEATIRSAKNFEYGSCKFVGKRVDLLGQGANTGFVATTADACGWGAALGPIWVVRDGAQPAAILEHGGASLTLGRQSQNGLRNIAISAGTAGRYSESLWKFDGVRYVKVKEKSDAKR